MIDPRPTCAVCQRKVDSIERTDCPREGATMYTVRCHGEMQIVTMSDRDVASAERITIGMAFEQSPRLTS